MKLSKKPMAIALSRELILFLFVLLSIIAFILGLQFRTSNRTVSNSEKITNRNSNAISVLSFTQVDGKIYLKYNDQIYGESTTESIWPKKVDMSSQPHWQQLLSGPTNIVTNGSYSTDDILSFRIAPDQKSFAFVMEWSQKLVDDVIVDYKVYYYDATKQTNQLSNPIFFVKAFDEKRDIPVIDQISPDGKYISFNMYPCLQCSPGKPETLLLNIARHQPKRIGFTTDFQWRKNETGKYQYREYISKACPDTRYPGQCFVDPTSLPLKYESFDLY